MSIIESGRADILDRGQDVRLASTARVDGAGDRNERFKRDGEGRDDAPILNCLVQLTALLEQPRSADALIAGLPVGAGGLSPSLALRALERSGFVASLGRRLLEEVPAPMLPCILLLDDQKACLLIEHREGGRLVVMSPEKGADAFEIGLQELAHRYTGQALFAKPTPRRTVDPADRDTDGGRSWFWGTILSAWPIYAEVALAALMINMFALASPLFVMNVYDRVVPNQALETLWALAVGVVTVFLFDFLLRMLRGYFVDAAGRVADIKLASGIFQHVLGIKMATKPGSAGAFANNLREFETLRDFFTSATLVAVIDFPFVLFFVGIIWLIGGSLALIPALAIPLVFAAGLLLQWPLNRLTRQSFKEAARKHGLLVESLHGLETVKAAGAEGQIQRRWEQCVGVTAETTTKVRLYAAFGTNVAALAQNLTTVGIVILGVHLIGQGHLTVGALVACTIIAGRAMAPLGQIAGILTRYHQAKAAYRALSAVIDLPVERPTHVRFLHRARFEGNITFKNVTFSYPGEKMQALDNVSFHIGAGERVGVIGRVGSGKTTLEKLVLGLFEPDAGTILIDGIDLRQIDPADLRRHIGVLLQDIMLFGGTLRDNITLGAAYTDDQNVLEAARLAGVDSFAQRHPLGFDAEVGERGSHLSGGQRQAVALARALLQNPPILLLDEPTSAMDNAAENRLKQQLSTVLAKKTLMLVTHRTSLLSVVDRLIVMDGGRLVADGPKDDVLKALAAGTIKGAA